MKDRNPLASEEQVDAEITATEKRLKVLREYKRILHDLASTGLTALPPTALQGSIERSTATRQTGVSNKIVAAIEQAGRFVTVQQIADRINIAGGNVDNLQITKALWRLKKMKNAKVMAHPNAKHYDRNFTWGLKDFLDKFAQSPTVMPGHEADTEADNENEKHK
ncbi:MAG: hypothetical protein IPI81_04555 [Flavobacteriales bacterium]|nr:hypothetical protein [Flavobacteriales bacterium]